MNGRILVSAALVLGSAVAPIAVSMDSASAHTPTVVVAHVAHNHSAVAKSEPCGTQNGITSCDDSYTVYANTIVNGLPVTDNDPSKNAPDMEVCRFNADTNNRSYFNGYLSGGQAHLQIDPGAKGVYDNTYQLCNTDVVGPLTNASVTVKPIKQVHAKRINKKHVRIKNRETHSILCHVGTKKKNIAVGKSGTFKSIKGTVDDQWVCAIEQPLGESIVGSDVGLDWATA